MEILQGFVEHLEWEEFDSVPVTGVVCLRELSHPLITPPLVLLPTPEVQEDGFTSVGQVHCAVQLDILKLLASSINMSIAHFLLGFDVRSRKQTKETTLQDPGKECWKRLFVCVCGGGGGWRLRYVSCTEAGGKEAVRVDEVIVVLKRVCPPLCVHILLILFKLLCTERRDSFFFSSTFKCAFL